eukprot:COSAG02_NODE_27995_length_598_cov_1.420842_2_plen_113_part_00
MCKRSKGERDQLFACRTFAECDYCVCIDCIDHAAIQIPSDTVVPAAATTTSAPSPTSGTLDEFYAANRLDKFKPALDELGVIEVAELADVSDEELRTMGLSLVQLKKSTSVP